MIDKIEKSICKDNPFTGSHHIYVEFRLGRGKHTWTDKLKESNPIIPQLIHYTVFLFGLTVYEYIENTAILP